METRQICPLLSTCLPEDIEVGEGGQKMECRIRQVLELWKKGLKGVIHNHNNGHIHQQKGLGIG